MGRRIIQRLSLLLLFAAAPLWAAPADGLAAALAKLKTATLAQDYQTLVAMTHPRAIAGQGGEEQALVNAQDSFLSLNQRGLKQSQLRFDMPHHYYPAGDDWVAFVPTHSRFENATWQITEDGYLIAVRPKAQAQWHFIDGAGIDVPQQIFDYFPTLPANISIPKKRSKIHIITPWTPSKNQ